MVEQIANKLQQFRSFPEARKKGENFLIPVSPISLAFITKVGSVGGVSANSIKAAIDRYEISRGELTYFPRRRF